MPVRRNFQRNSTESNARKALLQCLAVCGHCGKSLLVRYNKGRSYDCNQRTVDTAQMRSCFSVGGIEIDRVIARRFLELVSPAGLEAARAAARAVAERAETALPNQQLELEHCRYEAGLAERRYRQVDPDNRLIAATLERRGKRRFEGTGKRGIRAGGGREQLRKGLRGTRHEREGYLSHRRPSLAAPA